MQKAIQGDLPVASTEKSANQKHSNGQLWPDMFHTNGQLWPDMFHTNGQLWPDMFHSDFVILSL